MAHKLYTDSRQLQTNEPTEKQSLTGGLKISSCRAPDNAKSVESGTIFILALRNPYQTGDAVRKDRNKESNRERENVKASEGCLSLLRGARASNSCIMVGTQTRERIISESRERGESSGHVESTLQNPCPGHSMFTFDV